MKKTLLSLSILSMASLIFAATVMTDVPKKVLDAFKLKYANAKDTEWIDQQKIYIAEFEDADGFFKNATFDLNGKWLRTEFEINEVDIPAKVQTAAQKEFQFDLLTSAIQVEEQAATHFLLSFEQDNKIITLKMDEMGKVLNQSVENYEVDEDEDDGDDG